MFIDINNIKFRYQIIIFCLFFSSVLTYLLSFKTFNQTNKVCASIKQIPMNFAEWKGEDIPLDEFVYEILETTSVIHRKYESDTGYKVFLSIVYYPEVKVDFHSPESCLGGKGINVKKSQKTIQIIKDGKQFPLKINQLIIKHEDQNSLTFYFYKADNFLGPSYIKLRLNLAFNKLFSKDKGGALIRVSMPADIHSLETNAEILALFIQDIIPYVIKLL